MTTLAIEWNMYVTGLMVVLFLVISLMMMLIVLIQRPQGGGLSGAFGGSGPDGAGQTAFGAKTGDVLTTVTIAIFVLFLAMAVALNYIVQPPRAPDQTQITAPGTPIQPAGAKPAVPGVTPPTPVVPPVSQTGQQPSNVLKSEHGTVVAPEGVSIKKLDGPPPGMGSQPAAPAPAPTPAPAPGSAPSQTPATTPPAQNPAPASTPPASDPKPN